MRTPTEEGRLDILGKMLVEDPLDEDVDLQQIAKSTHDFSGSDLRELVRVARLEKMKVKLY